MALSFVQMLLVIFLLPAIATATSYHNKKLRSMHFTLYQQDIINETDFMILEGPDGPGLTPKVVSFGSILVLQDPLTETPDPSSKRFGTLESTGVTSTKDGLRSITVTKITLDGIKGLRGSISLAGVVNYLKPSDFPVAGGTGDFLFVQGYVTSSPTSFGTSSSVYKNEFHLYWPPYASMQL